MTRTLLERAITTLLVATAFTLIAYVILKAPMQRHILDVGLHQQVPETVTRNAVR